MQVKELMTSEPATVGPEATLGEAARLLQEHNCGSLPVVEGGRLMGIVTDRDIVVRAIAAGKDPKTTKVSDVMSKSPATVGPNDTVAKAEQLMAEHQVRRLPVVEDGHLEGIIVIGQIARGEPEEKRTGETLKEISKA